MEFGFYYYLCHIKGVIISTVFEMSRHKTCPFWHITIKSIFQHYSLRSIIYPYHVHSDHIEEIQVVYN